jgi:hypothetical protein
MGKLCSFELGRMQEVNLLSVPFGFREGLLPHVVNLSDLGTPFPDSRNTKGQLLRSLGTVGYDDFNPNRILTATWKKDTSKWYGRDGITPL